MEAETTRGRKKFRNMEKVKILKLVRRVLNEEVHHF